MSHSFCIPSSPLSLIIELRTWNILCSGAKPAGEVLIRTVKFCQNLPAVRAVKAKQEFSIFSSCDHFVQWSRMCWQYAQVFVLNTPFKCHQNLPSGLSCENRARLIYFLLWWPFSSAKRNKLTIHVTRLGNNQSYPVLSKFTQLFGLWKLDK